MGYEIMGKRKIFGEVFTPVKLVNEMLDTLPADVWTNPNLKWLDPCVGSNGIFALTIYQRLMDSLTTIDLKVREEHILTNMIYVVEIQQDSCLEVVKLFSKLNLYNGSFLEEGFDKHMKEVWGLEKFDIVMGNPPYQKQKETTKNKNSKKPKTQPIWHLFVQKSINVLQTGGYMTLVHPGGWRDLSGGFKETQNILKSKCILELYMFPFKRGLDIFGAKTNFDYYILRNEENKGCITEIHCENETIENLNLLDLDYIPGENINTIRNTFHTSDDDRVNLLHSYSAYEPRKIFMSKVESSSNLYPCVYMVSYKNIPTFLYSSRNDRGHFGQPKVIWASGSSGVIIDYNGEYGLTPFSAAIVDSVENLENIKKALESEKFIKEVMLFKNGLGHKYNNKVISMLKKDFWKEFID